MTHALRICIEVAVFSCIAFYASNRLNKPYPWNSNTLDYIEGLAFLTFVPTFLYALGKGIWLL